MSADYVASDADLDAIAAHRTERAPLEPTNEYLRRLTTELADTKAELAAVRTVLGGSESADGAMRAIREVLETNARAERAESTIRRVDAYAAEREAYGKRGRTVHSARIASDLRAILAPVSVPSTPLSQPGSVTEDVDAPQPGYGVLSVGTAHTMHCCCAWCRRSDGGESRG